MNAAVCVKSTVQITFFLVMKPLSRVVICLLKSLKLNFLIFPLKPENELKKRFLNVATIKYGFVELVVTLSTFMNM